MIYIRTLRFERLLDTKIVNFISLNNEQILGRPASVDLNSDELRHHWFTINSDICGGNLNTLHDLRAMIFDLLVRSCVPNETKYVKIKVFNTIKKIKKSKSSNKFRFDGKKWKFN